MKPFKNIFIFYIKSILLDNQEEILELTSYNNFEVPLYNCFEEIIKNNEDFEKQIISDLCKEIPSEIDTVEVINIEKTDKVENIQSEKKLIKYQTNIDSTKKR